MRFNLHIIHLNLSQTLPELVIFEAGKPYHFTLNFEKKRGKGKKKKKMLDTFHATHTIRNTYFTHNCTQASCYTTQLLLGVLACNSGGSNLYMRH